MPRLDVASAMSGPARTSTDPVTFGYAGYYARLQGLLDEVHLYNRALGLSEIREPENYRPPQSPYPCPSRHQRADLLSRQLAPRADLREPLARVHSLLTAPRTAPTVIRGGFHIFGRQRCLEA